MSYIPMMELELHGTPTTGYYWVQGTEYPVKVSRLYDTVETAEQARLEID